MDSSFYQGERKIPVPIAIISILLLFILLSLGLRRTNKTNGQVIRQNLVSSYEVTNVTPNSTSIVLCLQKAIPVELSVEPVSNATALFIAYDDRDLTGVPGTRLCNYFSLKNLQSGNYNVQPISGKTLISEKAISFSTGEPLRNNGTVPIWGKIMDSTGKPLETGVVIGYFDNAKPISTLVKNGDWIMPIHYLPYVPGDDTKLKIVIYGDNGKKTEIQSTYKQVDQISKTLSLGKNYNFTSDNVPNTSVLGEQTSQDQPLNKIDIIYPVANAVIPSYRPLFKGMALPNKTVSIIIDEFASISKNTKYKDTKFDIVANTDGIWTFTPYEDLMSGFHNIVIKTVDEKNKAITLRRNYTILKSGESVLGLATPSASITPAEMLITPTEIPEITPTETVITPEITSLPTAIPTQSLPKSGMDIYPMAITSIGLIVIGFGLLFFYL